MKETPTHYFCHLVGGIQTKNKLQEQFSCFLRGMDGELYQAKKLNKIKEYIIEKANELNEEYPDANPLTFPLHNTQKKTNITYAGLSLTALF
ncbi:hypothetical protein [Capnocytophaga sp. oral taxon 380]|uniref:hypothetical protein n=1 Tax=Capnocytophaga sp. oral taxon 380 TaxID=712217 RepID=UPI0002A36C74|nr:hypothetical protein [Capnocytophaga sp. oral taxon 380]EKY10398.1 hypothetical protein HMPREF9078_00101 [Capnocytophaga sp. oral taxon 380 str. F0488]